MTKKTGNMYRNTTFRNGGRKAGSGMYYDDYGEESGNPERYRYTKVRFPHDGIDPEELSGPVICYKGERRTDD